MSSTYITERAIHQGAALMARLDRERTPDQHEQYVRKVLEGIREHLVQRHLYDAVVRELHAPQNDRDPRSGGSADRALGSAVLHDKPAPTRSIQR